MPTAPRPTSARPATARWTAGLLAGLALGAGSLAVTPAPAGAAPAAGSCGGTSLTDQVKTSDAVFTGRVVSSSQSTRGAGSRRVTTYTEQVQVDLVYKGRSRITSPTVTVTSERTQEGGCSLGRLATDTDYLVVASADGSGFEAIAGTAPSADSLLSRLERIYPNPKPPITPEPATAQFTPVSTGSPTPATRLAAPGAALALVGLLGLLVVRRRSRS